MKKENEQTYSCSCIGCSLAIIDFIVFCWVISRLPQIWNFIFNGLDKLIK